MALQIRISWKYGFEQIGRGRLTNDTLISASASRLGITLLTVNERDFAKITEFCPLKWELW
jgi:predicted nucleic acid-binding protein